MKGRRNKNLPIQVVLWASYEGKNPGKGGKLLQVSLREEGKLGRNVECQQNTLTQGRRVWKRDNSRGTILGDGTCKEVENRVSSTVCDESLIRKHTEDAG